MTITLNEADLKYIVKKTINETMSEKMAINEAIQATIVKGLGKYVEDFVKAAGKNGVTVKQLSKAIYEWLAKNGGKKTTRIAAWIAKHGVKGVIKWLLALGVIIFVGGKILLPIHKSRKAAKQNIENYYNGEGIGYGKNYLVDFYKDPENSVASIIAKNKAMNTK